MQTVNSPEEMKTGRECNCSEQLCGHNTSVAGSKHCCGFPLEMLPLRIELHVFAEGSAEPVAWEKGTDLLGDLLSILVLEHAQETFQDESCRLL